MYIEACESGSIFEGTLDDSLKIYAVVRTSCHLQLAAVPKTFCTQSVDPLHFFRGHQHDTS